MAGVIYFVTPAWQRFALSEVVFDQRLDVIHRLAEAGIDARCVVIADDENLDLARARGFDTVEAPNVVSDKFNAGMEFAGKHGAEWIVPIGSDSWIDPAYFLGLRAGTTRTGQLYCHVTADRLGEARVRHPAGAGPYVFHRSLLEPSGFRPAKLGLMRRVDSSTVAGLGPIKWLPYHLHPYQYVGFRVKPFITSYETLMRRWGVAEHDDPWAILARHYPADLVERARSALAGVAA
jgi:hypothetical protein